MPKPRYQGVCQHCGAEFTKTQVAKYCSTVCSNRAYRLRYKADQNFDSRACHAQKGSAAEFFIMSWLMGRGLSVFWNVCRVGPADIVAWRPGGVPVLLDAKCADTLHPKAPSITEDGVHLVIYNKGDLTFTPEAEQMLGLV